MDGWRVECFFFGCYSLLVDFVRYLRYALERRSVVDWEFLEGGGRFSMNLLVE